MKTDKPFLKSFISAVIFTAIMICIPHKERMDFTTANLIVWLIILVWNLVAGSIVGIWAHRSKNPWSTLKIFGHVFYISFLMAICLLIVPLVLSLFS